MPFAFPPPDSSLNRREDSFEALNRSMACGSNTVGGFYLQIPLCVTDNFSVWFASPGKPGFPGPMQVSFREHRVPSHIVNNFKPLFLCTAYNDPYMLTRDDQASDTFSLGRKPHTSVIHLPSSSGSCHRTHGTRFPCFLLPSYVSPEWFPNFLLLFPLKSCAALRQTSWLKESSCWHKDQIPIRVFATN